jgi:hypothetical protein
MTINSSDLLSGASSARSTTSVVNKSAAVDLANVATANIALSGALTGNTLKTMLNISGAAGRMSLCLIRALDATTRTMRLVVTADGNVIYDKSITVSTDRRGFGAAGIGGLGSAGSFITAPCTEILWQSTLLVQISSSLTETDKIDFHSDYVTEA